MPMRNQMNITIAEFIQTLNAHRLLDHNAPYLKLEQIYWRQWKFDRHWSSLHSTYSASTPLTCARCKEDRPIVYRVRSEILNDLVCFECARAAMLLDLIVERIEQKNGNDYYH